MKTSKFFALLGLAGVLAIVVLPPINNGDVHSTTSPCDNLKPNCKAFYSTTGGNPDYDTVDVRYFSEALMEPGDVIWIEFPCDVDYVETHGRYPGVPTVTVTGNIAEVELQSATIPGAERPLSAVSVYINSYRLEFMLPNSEPFIFKITELPVGMVKYLPGDANGDGRVDMMDLAPVAFAIGRQNSGNSVGPGRIELDSSGKWAKKWTDTWIWDGPVKQTINYVHADCDGNGVVDKDDFKTITERLLPMEVTLFLEDHYSQTEFRAVYNGPNEYRAAIGDDPAVVLLPYDIEVIDPPSLPMLGYVFLRPLVETEDYRTVDLRVSFDGSALLRSGDTHFGRHELRDPCDFQPPGTDCAIEGAVTKIAEVGLFNLDNSYSLTNTDLVNSCIIEIFDPSPAMISGGGIDIRQYVFDGMMFLEGPNGPMPQHASCTTGVDFSDPIETCKIPDDVMIRDMPNDCGYAEPPFRSAPLESPDIIYFDQNGSETDTIRTKYPFIDIRVYNRSCNPAYKVSVELFYAIKDDSPINDYFKIPMLSSQYGFGDIPTNETRTCRSEWDFSVIPKDNNTWGTIIAVVNQYEVEALPRGMEKIPFTKTVTESNNVAARRFYLDF